MLVPVFPGTRAILTRRLYYRGRLLSIGPQLYSPSLQSCSSHSWNALLWPQNSCKWLTSCYMTQFVHTTHRKSMPKPIYQFESSFSHFSTVNTRRWSFSSIWHHMKQLRQYRSMKHRPPISGISWNRNAQDLSRPLYSRESMPISFPSATAHSEDGGLWLD